MERKPKQSDMVDLGKKVLNTFFRNQFLGKDTCTVLATIAWPHTVYTLCRRVQAPLFLREVVLGCRLHFKKARNKISDAVWQFGAVWGCCFPQKQLGSPPFFVEACKMLKEAVGVSNSFGCRKISQKSNELVAISIW